MKKQPSTIPAIHIQLRELFMIACECSYDIIRDEPIDGLTLLHDVMLGITDPEKLRKVFSDGFTPCVMGKYMEQIEDYGQAEKPFVIVVSDGDKVFAMIPSASVTY